jgi:hypothetical protein
MGAGEYWNPKTETLGRDELAALQLAKLRRLCEWAAARSPFRLSDLGSRCIAEHVARTIALSLLEENGTVPRKGAEQPAAPAEKPAQEPGR